LSGSSVTEATERANGAPEGLRVEEFDRAGALVLPRHGHDDVHLCVVLRGALVESDLRGEVVLERGGVRISPAGDEHRIRFLPGGAHCAILSVGRSLLADLTLEPPRERHFVPHAASRSPWGRALLSRVRRPASFELQESVVEMLFGRGARERFAPRPAWLSRVRDLLRDAPDQVERLAHLASEAGVHPGHLTRAFREHFGCSPSGYLRWRRLLKARRLIIDSDKGLAAIAHACGYADQAHLTRRFCRAFGTTPARARARR
jgi:AraC family transcriptional regulator